MRAGFGISTNTDPAAAVREAVASAGVAEPSLAFVSCTVAHDPEAVAKAFENELKGAPMHGVTSSGVLLESSGPKAGVGCLLFSDCALPTAFAATGAEAASELKSKCKDSDVKAVIMSTTPGAEEGVIKSIVETFGPNVAVYGGTAADNELNGSWRVLTNTGAFAEGVSLVAVTEQGGVKMGASMIGPYKPTDKVATATSAEGRKVMTINDKPAADWVKDWLGDDVKDQYENGGLVLPQTAQKPIGIKQESGGWISCHLAGLNTDKSVDFFTPVNQGDVLTVMESGDGPATGYAATLSEAYDVAKSSADLSDPKAGVLFYCGGMAIAVGDNLSGALTSDSFKSKVDGLPMLGMTVFGEQATLGGFDPSAAGKAENVQRNLSLGMLLFE